jgi:hypothetical protein
MAGAAGVDEARQLATDLGSTESAVVLGAMGECQRLALWMELPSTFGEVGGFSRLVSLLKGEHSESAAQTLLAFSRRSGHKAAMLEAGAVRSLVNSLRSSKGLEAQYAAMTLKELASMTDGRVAIRLAGGVSILLSMFQSSANLSAGGALLALADGKGALPGLADAGLVEFCAELLSTGGDAAPIASRILLKFALCPDWKARVGAQIGLIIGQLRSRECHEWVLETLVALTTDDTHRSLVGEESGVIPLLVSLISITRGRCRELVVETLANLAALEVNLPRISDAGAIPSLVRSLARTDPDRVQGTLKLLSFFVQAGSTELAKAGVIPLLVELEASYSPTGRQAAALLLSLSQLPENHPFFAPSISRLCWLARVDMDVTASRVVLHLALDGALQELIVTHDAALPTLLRHITEAHDVVALFRLYHSLGIGEAFRDASALPSLIRIANRVPQPPEYGLAMEYLITMRRPTVSKFSSQDLTRKSVTLGGSRCLVQYIEARGALSEEALGVLEKDMSVGECQLGVIHAGAVPLFVRAFENSDGKKGLDVLAKCASREEAWPDMQSLRMFQLLVSQAARFQSNAVSLLIRIAPPGGTILLRANAFRVLVRLVQDQAFPVGRMLPDAVEKHRSECVRLLATLARGDPFLERLMRSRLLELRNVNRRLLAGGFPGIAKELSLCGSFDDWKKRWRRIELRFQILSWRASVVEARENPDKATSPTSKNMMCVCA